MYIEADLYINLKTPRSLPKGFAGPKEFALGFSL